MGSSRGPRLVWKYEDEEDDGTEIGPAWVDTFGDDPVRPASTDDLGWVTRHKAREIAAERGYGPVEDD